MLATIEALARANRNWSPAQIKMRIDLSDAFAERVPSLQTVRRAVKDARDTSDPWTLRDAEPETIRIVLDALAVLTEASEGTTTTISVDLADHVGRVWRGAPDLDVRGILALALLYQAAAAHGTTTAELDTFLALRAWRDPQSFKHWLTLTWPAFQFGIEQLDAFIKVTGYAAPAPIADPADLATLEYEGPVRGSSDLEEPGWLSINRDPTARE